MKCTTRPTSGKRDRVGLAALVYENFNHIFEDMTAIRMTMMAANGFHLLQQPPVYADGTVHPVDQYLPCGSAHTNGTSSRDASWLSATHHK